MKGTVAMKGFFLSIQSSRQVSRDGRNEPILELGSLQ